MTTYILRHGQTDYSKRYLVNGDPTRPIRLSDEGVRSCGRAWAVLPLHSVRTWLASEFPRARQTAALLMGVPEAKLVVIRQLNELDYGEFEGRPFLEYAAWLDHHSGARRPPGARESQREGIRRMLAGVREALKHPGPRVLVCHGLLVSVLLWHRDRSPNDAMPLFFPEAPCAQPLAVTDEALHGWLKALLTDLEAEGADGRVGRGGAAILRAEGGLAVATVDRVDHSPEEDSPHA